MASLNRVTLLGNCTRDPQVKYLSSGTAVAEIGLAINEKWTDTRTKEKKEKTVFVDCTAWGRTAEVAGEYLSKGAQVCIEGKLDLDQWQDKQSGQNRQKLKVTVERLVLLGGGSGSGNRRRDAPQASAEPEESPSYPDDEIPF